MQASDGDGKGDTLVSIENLVGSAYKDVLRGDAGANVIDGSYGDDTIEGNGGADTLLGGSGADVITLLADPRDGGAPQAHGGPGNDTIFVDGTGGVIYGDAGADRLVIEGSGDTAYGGEGDDTLLVTGGGDNLLDGGNGADDLTGGLGNDTLVGGAGDATYATSGGNDVIEDVAGTADTLFFTGPIDAFHFRYEPGTNGFTIDDIRNGTPEGRITETGIDRFVFNGIVESSTQLRAYAAALGTSGRVVDGYVAGATVFADSNLDGVQEAGEASAITDATGHFTVADTSARLVAVNGTDIATRLPQVLPLSAPAGSQMITPLTTLLISLDGAASVPSVRTAFGIGSSFDLLASDPIAGAKAGDADSVAAFVAGVKVMDTLAAGTAFLGPLFGRDATSSFAAMLNGLAFASVGDGAVDLASPSIIRAALSYASFGASIAGDVLEEASDVIAAMNAAADARAGLAGEALLIAEDAVARTAQAGLAPALFAAGPDLTRLDAVLAQYTGPALDAAIAASVPQLGNVDGIACYCRSTLILSGMGEVPVEALRAGDHVVTASDEPRPVRWVGHRSYAGRFLAANPAVHPVRFRAGSLGSGLPRRDLRVSPEHAMFLDGVLIPARCLVNGITIIQERGLNRVDYFHVELDTHDILLAEGVLSESFLDDDSRGMFHNAFEYAALHPDAPNPDRFCAPKVSDGYALEAIRQRLAAVAGEIALAA